MGRIAGQPAPGQGKSGGVFAGKKKKMALDKLVLATIASVLLLFPFAVVAKDYLVGDSKGWTINFDYQAWAKDKVFHVGDRLVFKYTPPEHNVFKVNGTAFQDCTIPPANEAMISGNDIVELQTPGKKWYICGVGQHCAMFHQKLVIDVVPAPTTQAPKPHFPAPAPVFHIAAARMKARVHAKTHAPAPSPAKNGHKSTGWY
ncbi:hypothetical protein MLD38_007670 [Melastoma candidum]|uniref:Uncharacterized protein n=1 Tax=Melastoma candidum TaxID=119954 RepID=A0ACB9RRT7_9MYRT|nr:hypothetical protein MLD38_007670 [Melastoma candidum]